MAAFTRDTLQADRQVLVNVEAPANVQCTSIAMVTSDIQWYSESQDLSLSREEVEEVEADEHEVLDALLADLLVRFWDLQISTAIKEWILHNHSWMCLEGLPGNEMKVCVGSLSRASCTPLKIQLKIHVLGLEMSNYT